MKKILIGIISVFILTLGATFVFAHGGGFGELGSQPGTYHDQVQQVVESGTYDDLLSLREEIGFPIARWVDSQEDFLEFKQMREEMKEGNYMDSSFRSHGKGGMHGSRGCGFR